MLELDVKEQSQLNSLESSLSNTVNHKWPILHVHFITKPISHRYNKKKGALKSGIHLPQTDSCSVQLPQQASCTRNQDYRGPYCINSAVMLGTVERVAPMEISTASPKLDFQESTGSSAMPDRGDLLQIAIHPELSTELDDPAAVGEPVPTPKVSDKATCMEEVDTGSVLHSEENKRLYNQKSEGNESPSINKSAEMLPEICLMDKEHQDFSEETSGSCVHEEYTVVMSSKHTCPPCDLAEGGSCMCLEDQQVPLLPCTSHSVTTRHLSDIQKRPVFSKEAFVCDETTCSENDETNGASSLSMTLEGSLLRQSHNLCSQQPNEMPTCTEDQFQKDCPSTYLLNTCCVGTTDSHSQNVFKDNLLSRPGDEGNFTEAVSIQPSLPASMELGAKSCVIQDSSICIYNVSSITEDCLKDVTYASKQENNLDNSSQTNFLPLDLPISPPVDPIYINTTSGLVTDIDTHIVHHGNSEMNDEKQEEKDELIQMAEASVSEVLSLESSNSSDSMSQVIHCPPSHINHVSHGTDLPLACFTSHLPDSQNMAPEFTCDPPQPFLRKENFKKNHVQIEKGESVNPISDNLNAVTEPNNSMLSSPSQSSEPSTSKETFWSSDALIDVPCQTSPGSNSSLEIQQLHGLTPPLTISQNALVPYVDIWRIVPKSKLLDVSSLKSSKNLIHQKMKSQKLALSKNLNCLKESSILYAKDSKAAGNECGGKIHKLLVHSLKTPLVKGPNFNRVLKGSLCNHSALCCSNEIPVEEIPMKVPITNCPNHTCSSSLDAVNKSNPSALSTSAVVRTVRKSKFCRQTKGYNLPKLENLAHSTLFSSHCMQRTAIPAHTIARSSKSSKIAQTDIKCVTTEKHILTRSRNQASYYGTSEYMCTKSIQPSTLTKHASLNVETTFTNECTPLLSLCHSRPKKIAVGAVKRKRVCINAQNASTNMQANEKPLTMLDKPLLSKLQKDCLRQPTFCHMEVGVKTGKSVDNCMLKLEPQCLICCPTQGAKRPKTYNSHFGQAGTSDFQNFVCSTSDNTKRLILHPLRQSCKVQEISIFPRKRSLTCGIALKTEQSSTCNHVSIQENITSNPKDLVCNVSTAFQAHASQIPGQKLLPSKHVVPKTTSNLLSTKMTKMSIGFTKMKGMGLKQCTSEQTLLNHLSAVAARLSDACKGSSGPKLSNTTKVVPFRGVQFQARKLLKVFSCVNMKIRSQTSGDVFFASSRDHLLSRSLDLCPANHTDIFTGNLANSFPFPAFDNPTFPVSFHMKINPNFLTDFIQLNPPDYMFNSALPVTQSTQLSEWTLSFFLSPQFTAAEDSIQLFTQWNPHFRSSHSSRSEPSCEVQSDRSPECSILGLHTVLALSSPGCYRLWTRKRNLGSRIPTVQKQFATQFAHGLKGLPTPFFQNRGRSSLAFSLGRVLSTWSRHGMSAFSTDYATPHPRCNTQQLNQNITICNLDGPLHTHPQMSLDDSRQGPFSLPFLNSSLNPIPKTNLQASEPRLQFNVCSLQESYFKPPYSSSAFSDPLIFPLSNDAIDLGSFSSLSIEQDKVVRPSICWPAEQKDTHLCLSAQQRTGLEPPQNFSAEESNGLRSQLCLSTDQNVVLHSPSSLSTVQATSLELFKYLSTEPGKVLRSLYVLPSRQGIFRVSHSFPPEQNGGLVPPCTLSSEQVGGHVAPCALSTTLVDGLGAPCTLFTEQRNGLGLPCTLPTEQVDNCDARFSKSIEQHDGIRPSHFLSVEQDVPVFSHSISAEQGNSLQNSQCLSTEQGGALGPLCLLPLQQADVMGPPPSLTTQPIQENNFGRPHSLFSKQVNDCELPPNLTTYQKDNSQLQQNSTIFQDNTEIPCILSPPKAFEQKETLRVPRVTEKNQNQRNEKGERKPQLVSQIKIRKTIPKPDPNLTPMGLPKPKRLNKKEFSLEDIYTNKNYKSPPSARSLETIFEEPQEKNGILVSVSQTKRKRILEFRDCTVPRPKRAKGKLRAMPSCKRGRKAATEEVQLDALLIQKLMDLENFLLKEEALEPAADKPS